MMKKTPQIQLGHRGMIGKALISAVLLLSFARDTSGAPVTAEKAESVVGGWLKADRTPLQTALGLQIKRADTFNDAAGAPLYYIVYLAPEGFVIVAADDLVEPIIGFAPSGQFDPSSDNPLGALVSRDLPGRMAAVR